MVTALTVDVVVVGVLEVGVTVVVVVLWEVDGVVPAAVATGVDGAAEPEVEPFPRESATMPRAATTTMTLATSRVRSTAAR